MRVGEGVEGKAVAQVARKRAKGEMPRRVMWRKWGIEEKELNKEAGCETGCSEKSERKARLKVNKH